MIILDMVVYGLVKRIVAPVTALSSTTSSGEEGYLDNFEAVYHVPEQVYKITKAYADNQGRDFTRDSLNNLGELVTNSIQNFAETPGETFAVAGIVYLATRFSPFFVKKMIGF